MNRRKTRANFRIHQNIKYSETKPETALDSLCSKLGIVLVKGAEVQVPGYSISPDRQVKDTNVLLEADGPVHQSKLQRQKASWRDDILVQAGYRVLHIEAELLVCHGLGDSDRFWPYVSDEIKKFLESQEPSRYLRA